MKCPQCKNDSKPLGTHARIPDGKKIWGCLKCGFVFGDDGLALNANKPGGQIPGLGSLAESITTSMDKVFDGSVKSLGTDEAAVIQAVVSDLYVEAFSSGVKQGLLLGTMQTRYGKKGE